VRARLPQAKFLIVGSRAPDRFREMNVEGVELVGFVEELGPVLDKCRMSIAPLRYGAGTKGKIYTSLSHGLPCVSTSVGTEGMNLTHEQDVLVADTAEAFAAQVVRLHEDEALWNQLSANGYKFLEAHASLDVGRQVVASILEFVGLAGRPRRVTVPAAGQPMQAEIVVQRREQFEQFMQSALAERRAVFEDRIVRKHAAAQDQFDLEGWCEVCQGRTAFHVDKRWGWQPWEDTLWRPDWPEQCVCHRCQLNSRQRVMAARIRDHVLSPRSGPADVYVMDQPSTFFDWLQQNVPGPRWAQAPASDAAFDMVVAQDLALVGEPAEAIAEISRMLRPAGVLLLGVPAEATMEGCWQLLELLRAAGYSEPSLHVYWNESRGHLGMRHHYIQATKAAVGGAIVDGAVANA
jgi:hypothetical protein